MHSSPSANLISFLFFMSALVFYPLLLLLLFLLFVASLFLFYFLSIYFCSCSVLVASVLSFNPDKKYALRSQRQNACTRQVCITRTANEQKKQWTDIFVNTSCSATAAQ